MREDLRVLTYLCLRDHWAIVPAYIRTYHNETCDFASCEEEAVVRKDLESRRGMRRLHLGESWDEAMRMGFLHRPLTWESLTSGRAKLALQRRETRLSRGPTPLPFAERPAAEGASEGVGAWRHEGLGQERQQRVPRQHGGLRDLPRNANSQRNPVAYAPK